MLTIALRLVAHCAEFFELGVHVGDAALELEPRLHMAAFDARGVQLRQRQHRRFDLTRGQVKMMVGERWQNG